MYGAYRGVPLGGLEWVMPLVAGDLLAGSGLGGVCGLLQRDVIGCRNGRGIGWGVYSLLGAFLGEELLGG